MSECHVPGIYPRDCYSGTPRRPQWLRKWSLSPPVPLFPSLFALPFFFLFFCFWRLFSRFPPPVVNVCFSSCHHPSDLFPFIRRILVIQPVLCCPYLKNERFLRVRRSCSTLQPNVAFSHQLSLRDRTGFASLFLPLLRGSSLYLV